jgi:hypothetical protein
VAPEEEAVALEFAAQGAPKHEPLTAAARFAASVFTLALRLTQFALIATHVVCHVYIVAPIVTVNPALGSELNRTVPLAVCVVTPALLVL